MFVDSGFHSTLLSGIYFMCIVRSHVVKKWINNLNPEKPRPMRLHWLIAFIFKLKIANSSLPLPQAFVLVPKCCICPCLAVSAFYIAIIHLLASLPLNRIFCVSKHPTHSKNNITRLASHLMSSGILVERSNALFIFHKNCVDALRVPICAVHTYFTSQIYFGQFKKKIL